MEDIRQQQLEALQAAGEYIGKLIPGMETVANELETGRKEDTEDFLKQCMDGLNWIIEIYNRITELLAEHEVVINKSEVNSSILLLGDALREKNDEKTALAIQSGVIPFLTKIKEAAASI